VRDSYARFFSEGYITKEQFFEFGLSETIYASLDSAREAWENLKYRIDHNQDVYIRSFGRNAANSHLFLDFYKKVLENENIKIDPTNNAEPTKLIKELTGYSKTKNRKYELIRNYQVSHVFGRTKNAFTFTAPWNIVYMPKLLDPFTGHEATGDLVLEYQKRFQSKIYNHFSDLIEDYNNLLIKNSYQEKIDDYLIGLSNTNKHSLKDIGKLKNAVKGEFTPISI
tara:strand:+ start:31644 stop:32318 length:675 start_codon:yes stop_codon:yes gene_type:complete